MLKVHFLLFGKELIDCLLVHFVGDAAVYRTNSGTLGLFVEALALSALVGGNIISINADGCKTLVGVYY
jgi:hypothetical protein